MLKLLKPDFPNLPCLYSTFPLNTPRYFLDFAYSLSMRTLVAKLYFHQRVFKSLQSKLFKILIFYVLKYDLIWPESIWYCFGVNRIEVSRDVRNSKGP